METVEGHFSCNPPSLLCTRYPKWGQLSTATAVPEEASVLGLCSSESTRKANTRKASPVSLTSQSHQQQCFLFAPQFYTTSPKNSKPKHQQTKIKGKPKRRRKQLMLVCLPPGTLLMLPWQGRLLWHLTSGLVESTGSQRDGQGCPQRPPPLQKMGTRHLDKDHLQSEAQGTWVGAERDRWPVPEL